MLRCFSSFSALVVFICFAQAASQGAPPSWLSAELAAISRPAANPVFTASGLWSAITAWDAANPGNTFLVAGDDQASQRMLAAFLGNVAQETGGLQFNVELADGVTPCTLLTCPNYVAAGSSVGYWGRGALQVTCWGGVWCSAYSDVAKYYGRPDIQSDPDVIATNATLAWGSALVFWMTNTGAGGLGPASAWVNKQSFGGTYATINGGLECPPQNTYQPPTADPRVANRIANFYAACAAANVNTSCASFDVNCPGGAPASGMCSIETTWPCTWDGDCGQKTTGGVCNVAKNKGLCSVQTAWGCFQNSECGSSGGFCKLPANKGTCSIQTSWACWMDSDCGDPTKGGTCALPFLGTCHDQPTLGCRKDTDCAQPGAAITNPCTLNPPGGQVCAEGAGKGSWACFTNADCGAGGVCPTLAPSGICGKNNNWGCRYDAQCGSGDRCWVNPGPTGVPQKPDASKRAALRKERRLRETRARPALSLDSAQDIIASAHAMAEEAREAH